MASLRALRKQAERRRMRVRRALRTSAGGRCRLSVCLTGKHVYAQVIDDRSGRTVASASTCESGVTTGLTSTSNLAAARLVGETVGRRAVEAGVKNVIYDRGGRAYHGKVEAIAAGARAVGLDF